MDQLGKRQDRSHHGGGVLSGKVSERTVGAWYEQLSPELVHAEGRSQQGQESWLRLVSGQRGEARWERWAEPLSPVSSRERCCSAGLRLSAQSHQGQLYPLCDFASRAGQRQSRCRRSMQTAPERGRIVFSDPGLHSGYFERFGPPRLLTLSCVCTSGCWSLIILFRIWGET